MKKTAVFVLAAIACLTAVLLAGCSSSSSTTTKYILGDVTITVDNAWKGTHPTQTTHFNNKSELDGTEMLAYIKVIGTAAPDAHADQAAFVSAVKTQIAEEFPDSDASKTVATDDSLVCDGMYVVKALQTYSDGEQAYTTHIACFILDQKAYFITYKEMSGETVASPFDDTVASVDRN